MTLHCWPPAPRSQGRVVVRFARRRLSLRERTSFRGAKGDKLFHYPKPAIFIRRAKNPCPVAALT